MSIVQRVGHDSGYEGGCVFPAGSVTSMYEHVVPWVALLLIGAVVGALVASKVPSVGRKTRKRVLVILFVSLPFLVLLYVSPAFFERVWGKVAEPHFQPSMSVDLLGCVHHEGQPYQWSESFVAKPGARVDLLMNCVNTGMGQADNVVIRIGQPASLTPVPWTAYFGNSNYPRGVPATAWGDGTAIFAEGLNLGSYLSGANCWVIIVARVPKRAPAKDDGRTTMRADGLVKYTPVAFARCDRSGEARGACEIQVKY